MSATENRGTSIRNFQRTVERVLSSSRVAKQSGLTQLLSVQKNDGLKQIKVHPPTDGQINKILKLAQTHLHPPISVERGEAIRQAAKKWYG